MKLFIGIIFLIGAILTAEASDISVKHFELKENRGGLIGNKMIFLYKNNSASKLTKEEDLNLLAKYAQKELCKDKTKRDLIKKYDLEIIYIYPTKDFKEANIIVIDGCK